VDVSVGVGMGVDVSVGVGVGVDVCIGVGVDSWVWVRGCEILTFFLSLTRIHTLVGRVGHVGE